MFPVSLPSKEAFQQGLTGVMNDSPWLRSLPWADWLVSKACGATLPDSYPPLLESLSRLGLYITAAGFSVSLLNCYIIPTICCGAIMMIFRLTIIEVRKQAALNKQIQRLETANASLEIIISRQEKQVSQLQKTLKEANITAEHIRELKKEEQESLKACQSLQQELQTTTVLLAETERRFDSLYGKFQDEVDRLSKVKP